jgi:hypothetical protein
VVESDWTRRDDTSFSSETLRVTIQEACLTCLALWCQKVGKAPYRSPPQTAKSAQREAELAYAEAE